MIIRAAAPQFSARFNPFIPRAAFQDSFKPAGNDAVLSKILASKDLEKIADEFRNRAYKAGFRLPPLIAQYHFLDVRLASKGRLVELEFLAAGSQFSQGTETLLATPDGKGGYGVKIADYDFFESPNLVLKNDGKPCQSRDEVDEIIRKADVLASATVTLPDDWKPLSEILYEAPDKQFKHVMKLPEIEEFKTNIRQWAAKNETGTAVVIFSLHPMEGGYKLSSHLFPEKGEWEAEKKRGLLCRVSLPGEAEPHILAFLVSGDKLWSSNIITVRDIDGEKKELKDILQQSTKALVREEYTYDANNPKRGFVKN